MVADITDRLRLSLFIFGCNHVLTYIYTSTYIYIESLTEIPAVRNELSEINQNLAESQTRS